MASTFRIRAMTSADLARAGELAGKLVRLHRAFDPRRFLHLEHPEVGYARYFASELGDSDAVLLVAEEGDASGAEAIIVGYAYGRLEPRSYNELLDACGKLHDLYVAEQARTRGVGEALAREVIRILKEKGAPRVVLLTAVQNEAAARLFRRLGFRPTMIEMTCEAGDVAPRTEGAQ